MEMYSKTCFEKLENIQIKYKLWKEANEQEYCYVFSGVAQEMSPMHGNHCQC